MGAYCSPTLCQPPDQPEPLSKAVASKTVPMPTEAKAAVLKAHEGQRRASLQIKSGGFAIKNFAPTNRGKIEANWQFASGQLGKGGFGQVRMGKDKRTGRAGAIKIIRKGGQNAKQLQRLQEEIEIMRLLDHPNIVRFYESFEDRRCIYLCLELCNGGELFTRICEAKKFDEESAAHCVKQMLLAVNYLHQNFIMHRDLKPENWLLATKDEVQEAPLKLIDFGISKRFQPGQASRTQAGTPNYVAPEVLFGEYDEKCDIWSLGVICYVMLVGTFPFKGKKTSEVLAKVKKADVDFESDRWRKISGEAKGLVKGCLTKFTPERPSAATALQHDWLSEEKRMTSKGSNGSVRRRSDRRKSTMGKLELGGLQAFGRMHQMKRAVLTVIATQLTDAKIKNLKDMFMEMDSNKDGTLSVAELKRGLRRAKIDLPPDVTKLIDAADTDGSGVIDYTEFLAATMDKKLYQQEEAVWQAFKKFDLDGSGTIDRSELCKVLGDESVTEAMHLESEDKQRLEALFDKVDVNHDGQIDFNEFFAMMKDPEDLQRKVTAFGINQQPRLERTGSGNDIGLAAPEADEYHFISKPSEQPEAQDGGDELGAYGLRASTLF